VILVALEADQRRADVGIAGGDQAAGREGADGSQALVRRRDRAAAGRQGQAVGQALECGGVGGPVDTVAVERGEQSERVGRVDYQVFGVARPCQVPVEAGIGGRIDAARPGRPDDVGVGRVDQHGIDPLVRMVARAEPGRTRVGGLEHAHTKVGVEVAVGLAGAGVEDVGVVGVDSDRAHRCGGLLVGGGGPRRPVVGRLPDAALGCADVDDIWVIPVNGDAIDPPADVRWADAIPLATGHRLQPGARDTLHALNMFPGAEPGAGRGRGLGVGALVVDELLPAEGIVFKEGRVPDRLSYPRQGDGDFRPLRVVAENRQHSPVTAFGLGGERDVEGSPHVCG